VVTFDRKLTVTCSFASSRKSIYSLIERNKKLRVPTFVGKVHVEPGAIPDLIHDTLSLQHGEMV